jgi:hypothetical protein
LGAPSEASAARANRSKSAGPPEPTSSAPAAPGSSCPAVPATVDAAASKVAAVSGRRTLSPSAPSAWSSAEKASWPVAFVVVGVGVGLDLDVGVAAYRSWNGYGVVKPSEGGKTADLTAFSTQEPVGVPANFPDTVDELTLPLLPMTTLTIAMPGTLNWL